MSVIAWPDFGVNSFRWSRTPKTVNFDSIFGRQSLSGSAPVWEVEMTMVPQHWQQSIARQAFIESLDGYTNQVALWNLYQPQPAGTMRGSMTLRDSAGIGQTFFIPIAGTGQIGKTLKAGDLLGIGSGITQQVVRIAADAVADTDGAIYATLLTPLRNYFPAGTPVVWDRPKALFRQKSLTDGIEFVAKVGNSWSLSLVEDFRP